ncbi:TadE/TadG family type IV pilus assembly protein [Qipengyuania marisflavi]|nr:TadE/TadG family type IV pilus assembly protein [Qipengyuania marisflavi]
MIALRTFIARLRDDAHGTVVIETAFVVPILALLALGGFETSRIVSRHSELQAAAAEAAAIVLASTPDEESERDTIEDVVEASTGLIDSKVSLNFKYRCDTTGLLTEDLDSCGSGAVVSEFIIIVMRDTYTPLWTEFGIGSAINYRVQRRVQIS